MAESNPWRHWKTRKIPQVIWVIDEIYNNLWRKTINQQRLQKLGDELDAEKLLQMPKPWSVIKMEKNLTTKHISNAERWFEKKILDQGNFHEMVT